MFLDNINEGRSHECALIGCPRDKSRYKVSMTWSPTFDTAIGVAGLMASMAGIWFSYRSLKEAELAKKAAQSADTAAQAAIARGSAYGTALNRLGDITGRYYGQPGSTGYMAPVESRDVMGDISPYQN